MPTLAEYLGAILTEVTAARLQADIESARIAQLYASHPYLQHMSVPRFRLPQVVLNLPVAVAKFDPVPGPATPTPAVLAPVRQSVQAIIDQELTDRKIEPTPDSRGRLAARLDAVFNTLAKLDRVAVSDALAAAQETTQAALDAIEER